uniref:Uncharacterized protein n=1 Tax=Candidatus Kentrum sp. DK TaxID=2126562 RepID=A0A450SYE0_9GAMM|nr:MAG: hypothetical protein BECKDK2373C_GA0170839_107020 [Candidatus Kentron sp. DK]VFJ59365.1 MAG: hypothetical protein BECKDK2373B_GA0170837_108213 [Candidatus Kentron sp. DK]
MSFALGFGGGMPAVEEKLPEVCPVWDSAAKSGYRPASAKVPIEQSALQSLFSPPSRGRSHNRGATSTAQTSKQLPGRTHSRTLPFFLDFYVTGAMVGPFFLMALDLTIQFIDQRIDSGVHATGFRLGM